jgi:hypothetical protein
MATVDGITAAKAQEIEDASIVDGTIDVNGHLMLTTAGGTIIDAGLVKDDTLLAAHESDVTTHGATGAVVGTTNTQTISNKTLTTPTIGSFINAQHSHTSTTLGGNVAVDAVLDSSDTSLTARSLGSGDVDNGLSVAATDTLAPGKYLILGACRGFTLGGASSTRLGWDLSTSSGTLYSSPIVTQSEGTLIQGGASLVGYLVNGSNAVVTMTVTKLNDSGVLADTSTNGFLVAIRLSDMT